jgi:hypothetical protein
MRGVVYPATQYDVYPSAPESDAATSGTGSPAGGSAAGGGSPGAVYISKLDVAAGGRITNGEKLAEIDGEPLFALAGRVPAWRDITPGESGPDVAELQQALASLGYYQGGDTPGFFGAATQGAVAGYYEHLGYAPPATGGVPMTDVIFLPSLPANHLALARRRHGADLGAGTGRVRGHDHLRRQPAGAHPDHAAGDLHQPELGQDG